MNRNTMILLVGAVAIGLFLVLGNRTNANLARQSPLFSSAGLIPGAGPNTPINTWGTSPYRASGQGQTLSPGGPTVAQASAGAAVGLAGVIASIFKGSSSQAGTMASASLPGGGLVYGPPAPANPAAEAAIFSPIAAPINSAVIQPYIVTPPPPGIQPLGVSTPVDLSTLNLGAPPSPIVTDVGLLPTNTGFGSGYNTLAFDSSPTNYAAPTAQAFDNSYDSLAA